MTDEVDLQMDEVVRVFLKNRRYKAALILDTTRSLWMVLSGRCSHCGHMWVGFFPQFIFMLNFLQFSPECIKDDIDLFISLRERQVCKCIHVIMDVL